jgi:hypothetical protein
MKDFIVTWINVDLLFPLFAITVLALGLLALL